MATSLATFSAFALNNRPATLETNRNGAANLTGVQLPSTIGQHWIPSLDNTYDLGQNSTPLRWRNLWMSGNASVVGSVTAGSLTVGGTATFTNGPLYVGPGGLSNYSGSTPNIGATGAGRWGGLWCTTINTTGLISTAAINVTSLAVSGTQPAMFSGFLLPSNSAALDLGSGALSWRDLYITGNIYKNGVLYNPGVVNLGDLLPAAHNVYNVGSFALQWKNGYFAGNLVTNLLQANNVITAGLTSDAITCSTNLAVGGSVVIGVTTGPSYLYSDNSNSNLGQSIAPWQTSWATTSRTNVLRPIADTGSVLGSNAVVGTVLGNAGAAYETAYIGNVHVDSLLPRGLVASLGSSGSRFSQAWLTLSDTTSMFYTDSYRRGWNYPVGTDDTAYDNVPIVRGVIDGTAKSLSGVKSSSAISNGTAYPNVVQYCSPFAIAVYVQKLAPGDYWVTMQSQYNTATQNADPSKRGLPRVNGTYNATSGNPRALPVIEVTPYYFPQTRSDQGAAMDSKMYMCVTDVRMVGDDATGQLPNTPDGSYWQFRVKSSTAQDVVFAFTVWSGFHGKYKAAATSGGAITLAYDYDADYYTDYLNPLTYNSEQPNRGQYRGRMQSLIGTPGTKLYDDATAIAFFVVGEFVPLLP